MSWFVEFGVLGPLRVVDGGREVDIRRGISRTLLTVLLLRVGDTASATGLMEILWGDEPPRNPANALQIQISHLRKALSTEPPSGQPIVTRPGGYTLDVEPTSIDAVRFERLLAGVAPMDEIVDDSRARADLDRLEVALALWRGDALVDVAGEGFAQGARARLDEMRWGANEQRIDVLLALGRHRDAVGEVGRLIAEQPLRERLHEQLMLALYRCGRQADSLRAYDAARVTLVDELGLDPGPGLQHLQQQVLGHDPALEWVPAVAPSAVATASERSERGGRSATWRRNFVPAPLTQLIGRAVELDRLTDLMATARLVTLTGPGGAGKTRLAIDLAGREPADTPVWYVDLSSIELPELVASTVAASLGATTGPNEQPGEVVASALSGEAGLLVLDTCEHVLSGAASLVRAVLERAPRMRVLATSRRPLLVAGEAAWPVPPLGVASPDAESVEAISSSPAVQLFCERARGVRPDFTLTEENAAAVAGICLALDGLPLAIELAAARTDVVVPATILRRLQNRFDLLVDGAADAAERQQTLRGAIDWSINLLTEPQRRFFARLGAFSGGFDLRAAEEVAGEGTDDPLGVLAGLVRHSMVVTDGADRFHLLDTLRAYAGELLAGLDADETRRRHAEHYTQLAERFEALVRGPEQADALRRLRTEIANFRSALEWSLAVGDVDVATRLAGSLAWFWALDGRLDVATRHLRRAVEVESATPAARAKVLWGYSLLVAGLGYLDAALEAGQRSTAIARELGDDAAIGSGLNAVAVGAWSLGDLDTAIVAHDEAIERFAAAGDIWGESICRVLRARTALDLGDPDAATRLQSALDTARRCGDVHVLGLGLCLLAELQASEGAHDEAIRTATESLVLQESIGYIEGTISALHLLARFHAAVGDDCAARAELLRGLRLAWKMQHAAAICEAIEGLAMVASRAGDTATAGQLVGVARAERARRNLKVRPRDSPEEVAAVGAPSSLTGLRPSVRADSRPIADVVAELLV